MESELMESGGVYCTNRRHDKETNSRKLAFKSLFGGSSARDTIQRPMDTVIVPNIPLEFQDDVILAEIYQSGI